MICTISLGLLGLGLIARGLGLFKTWTESFFGVLCIATGLFCIAMAYATTVDVNAR